jgi:hypothetical protein
LPSLWGYYSKHEAKRTVALIENVHRIGSGCSHRLVLNDDLKPSTTVKPILIAVFIQFFITYAWPLTLADKPSYFVLGNPAAFQALKPPAMERTFL